MIGYPEDEDGQSKVAQSDEQMLQGRTRKVVSAIIHTLASTAPREWERMMRRVRMKHPRLARILMSVAEDGGGQQGPGMQQGQQGPGMQQGRGGGPSANRPKVQQPGGQDEGD